MEPGHPSRTAMGCAVLRHSHREHDPPPWIFDDPYALVLVGPAWVDIQASWDATLPAEMKRQARACAAVRSRYAEDRLEAGSFEQYVILGAGLDSLAWRRPDLVSRMRIFEVDHPSTQAWKRSRVEALALPTRDRHIFAPIDFEHETLQGGLSAAGFDWSLRTLFSWLGVTMYLAVEAIEATLRTVSPCAPGSEIVLSYWPNRHSLDDIGRGLREILVRLYSGMGEPPNRELSPAEIETLITGSALTVVDHPATEDLCERYFRNRTDSLTPWSGERLITAQV